VPTGAASSYAQARPWQRRDATTKSATDLLLLPQIADASSAALGEPFTFAGVYDGHGELVARSNCVQIS
jgi:hypothetical protein